MEGLILICLWLLWLFGWVRAGTRLNEGRYGDAAFECWKALTAFGAISLINGWV